MLKIATIVVLSIVFCLTGNNTLYAQNQTPDLERPNPQSVAKIARSQNVKVAAELQRQQKFLQDIAARYEEVSETDLTPLLKFPYVWNALRENRSRIAQPKVRLTVSQSRLFKKAYDLLEEETLLSFLDQQIAILTETLELDETQQADVQKILTMDLSNKRSLLLASLGPQDFQRRLDKVSDTTEKSILLMLSEEQRNTFFHQQTFNRDRLVG